MLGGPDEVDAILPSAGLSLANPEASSPFEVNGHRGRFKPAAHQVGMLRVIRAQAARDTPGIEHSTVSASLDTR